MRRLRIQIARWVSPRMCSASLGVVQRYQGPSYWDDSTKTIVSPSPIETHRACGKKPGHPGEHGPWGRWYRWRNRFADLLEAGL